MFESKVTTKLKELTVLLALFFTPLLFFTSSHDQFELPKITFLSVLCLPLLILSLLSKKYVPPKPVVIAVLIFVFTQILSSTPWISLSMSTSLLGEYENFSGLTTLLVYLAWFLVLFHSPNSLKTGKYFLFSILSAFLLSLYALGQHYQFDFVQWNPESINSSREFGSLGNPNFLAAYLSMCIPLVLGFSMKRAFSPGTAQTSSPLLSLFLMSAGLCFLILGTFRMSQSFHISDWKWSLLMSLSLGLFMFSSGFLLLIHSNNLIFSFLSLFILGFGLFSTGSRGGFLATFMGIMVYIFFIVRKENSFHEFNEKLKAIPKIRIAGWLSAACLVAVFLLNFGSPFLMRLKTSIFHIGESLATSRLHIWIPALRMIHSHPLLGVGLDAFKIAFPYYSGIEFNQIDGQFVSSRTAHNEILQVASTSGLLGMAIYLCVIYFFTASWLKAYRKSIPTGKFFLIGILSSVVAYHTQNLFSFDVVSLCVLWYASMALIANGNMDSPQLPGPPSVQKGGHKPWNVLMALLFSILVIYALFFPLQRLGADIAFAKASAYSDYLKKPDPESAPSALQYYSGLQISYMRRAVALNPLEVKYHLYLGLAYEQNSAIEGSHTKESLLTALDSYQNAVNLSPFNAYYYNDQGRVFKTLGRRDRNYLKSGEAAYRKAVQWAPSSPYFLVNHAHSLADIGDSSACKAELEKAFQLDPSFTSGILSQVGLEEFRTGQKEIAFGDLNEAIQGNPSNAEAYYYRGLLYLVEKKKSKALKDFLTAKKLMPNPPPGSRIKSLDDLIQQSK